MKIIVANIDDYIKARKLARVHNDIKIIVKNKGMKTWFKDMEYDRAIEIEYYDREDAKS